MCVCVCVCVVVAVFVLVSWIFLSYFATSHLDVLELLLLLLKHLQLLQNGLLLEFTAINLAEREREGERGRERGSERDGER